MNKMLVFLCLSVGFPLIGQASSYFNDPMIHRIEASNVFGLYADLEKTPITQEKKEQYVNRAKELVDQCELEAYKPSEPGARLKAILGFVMIECGATGLIISPLATMAHDSEKARLIGLCAFFGSASAFIAGIKLFAKGINGLREPKMHKYFQALSVLGVLERARVSSSSS